MNTSSDTESQAPPLHHEHLADLRKSGLTDDTIRLAGIRTVTPRDISKKLGGNVTVTSCYELPYGKDFSRFRCFYNGTKGPKYLQKKDAGNHLYIPFQLTAEILADTSKPILITEGEKKSLKAAQEGLFCAAIGGLWNWKQDGKLLPDFDRLALKDRQVLITPDNDWQKPNRHGYKKNLVKAVYGLASALTERGARVSVVSLPDRNEKVGLDDYLCTHTATEFLFLPRRPIAEHDATTDLDVREWPTLDPKVLRGIAGDFVELATRKSEADPAAVLFTFLCRFGIEAGTGAHVMVGDTRHHARLNVAVVGASSKARKGTSGQPVKRLFRFDAQERTLDHPLLYVPATETAGPLSSGEGIIYAVRDEVKAWQVDKKTGEGQWITVDPGVEDKRLFVFDEELAAALKCTKREGNTLSTVIRVAFDGGKLSPLTKNNRIAATNPHIGIVTHTTAAELSRLLDETETLNGFANRFLWICSRRQKLVPLPKPMPEDELRQIQARLLRILRKVKTFGEVHMNHEAREHWCGIYEALSREQPGLVGCVVNRAEALVIRLSLIYALLDESDVIRREHLEAALAMWSYAKSSAEYIFAGREPNPIAQAILAALESGPLSMTDIHRLLSNHATKSQIQTAIQELVGSGRVEVTDEQTPGRNKKIISLAKKAKEAKKGERTNGSATSAEDLNSQPCEKRYPDESSSDTNPELNSHNSLSSPKKKENYVEEGII